MRLREGELFAGYRVLRQLGRGGMAFVYLAEEAGIDRQVALKLLPDDVADDAVAAKRFAQEAQTIAALEHQNIVPLYRYGIDRGVPWMALRLVRDGDLAERLQRPLAVTEGLQIFRQIAQALDFAHGKRVIHRDLKPQNVLLSRDPGGDTHAYLADFGIAKLLAGSPRVRTGTGGILGTPQYMAPEAARGEVLGPAADIYALGVMAFQWQTGTLPFDADTPLAVLLKQISDPPPESPLRALPAEVAQALRKALDKDARARPATAAAFVDQLAMALGTGTARPVPAALTARIETAARSSPPSLPPLMTNARRLPAEPTVCLTSTGPRPSPSPPTAGAALSLTSDGLVLVPVGGALPAVGVPFRHALKGGGVGPEMVVLPGGSFRMGSPDTEKGRHTDEGPVRAVTIRSFAMGITALTFADWDLCVTRGGCGGHLPDDRGWGRGNRPVINVSWEDAQRYLAWLKAETEAGYRLPSESEWEYAARAGTQTAYWWGDEIGRNRANCAGCGSQWDCQQTAPVISFAANGFGLYDTSGNVWEWVQDCYADSYAMAPTDGRAVESANCRARVLRGASWDDQPARLRSAYRFRRAPSDRFSSAGFRVALGKV